VALPDDAQVVVQLLDAAGHLVDSETVKLASYRGTVNQSHGTVTDLAITGISHQVLTVELRGTGAIETGYRIRATATSASLPPVVLDTGPMGSAQGWPVALGARFGDFASSNLEGAARFTRPSVGPSAAAQVAFLQTLLEASGWSYKIVTEPEEFERELHSGAYNEYAILAQRERLNAQTRDELREAVFRGEGLLFSIGDHPDDDDEFHGDLDRALGIRRAGELHDSRGVVLGSSLLGLSGSASFAFDEDVAAVKLDGAQLAGQFEGSRRPLATAVTTYSYGQGRSVYIDYRLLAEAAQAGSSSLHANLLEKALEFVQPGFAQPYSGEVVPLQVTLVNQGVATPGLVQLPLPSGVTPVDPGTAQVTNGSLRWTFNLAVNQQLTVGAWIRLPNLPGPVPFNADIETGTSGKYVDYTHVTLTLNASAAATLGEASALASANRDLFAVRPWLTLAQFWVDRGRNDFAVASLIAATDELIECPAPQANALRVEVDQVIWTLSRTL
jgi:hypothetical protein